MKELHLTIAGELFEAFPQYVRGVVVAREVQNGPSPEELTALLREGEEKVRRTLGTANPAEHPRIKAWREAYRKTGVKPAEFRSSIEAMARRAVKGQELPSINAVVDIGNILSLRHLVPVGGHSLDEVTEDIRLRPATGEEVFVPFGETEEERPLPGEIIFAEGNTVLTRRWTWRQANHTLTLPESRSLEINVDGLPPVTREEVDEICAEMEELLARFCGGTFRRQIVSAENPRMKL